MFRKNVAGQFIHVQGVDATTGGIKSAVTWTVRRCIDGTFAAATGTATEDGTTGWYKFALSQADTNGNNIGFNFTGTGAIPQTVNIVTTACDPTSTAFGLSLAKTTNITGFNDIAATAIVSSGAITTSGGAVSTVTNTTQLNGAATVVLTDASSDAVMADAIWNALTASYGSVNTYGALVESGNVGGGNIVAASVTGAVGSVTGSVGSVTGAVTVGTNNDKTGYSLTATTGLGNQTANITGNLSGSVGSVTGLTASDVGAIKTKTDFLPSATAGAAGGVFIAGANAATSITTALTANIVGNITGTIDTVTTLTNAPTGMALEATLTAMKGATFSGATDSLEAIRDRGDAAWTTATGFATPTNITAATGVVLAGVTHTGAVIPTVSAVTGLTTSNLDATVSSRATPAQVNAEVLDVFTIDTFAEPAQGAPAATTTLANKIAYLFKFLRNKKEQTATTLSIYDDAGTTVDHKATISDNGTTYTHGEIGTGP